MKIKKKKKKKKKKKSQEPQTEHGYEISLFHS